MAEVSIPNGMEFYARESPLEQGVYRFNSQRDGILLKIFNDSISARPFQFPTGWNSTAIIGALMIDKISFNSQRDGILRDLNFLRRIYYEVSIPNGMEFYPDWFELRAI